MITLEKLGIQYEEKKKLLSDLLGAIKDLKDFYDEETDIYYYFI